MNFRGGGPKMGILSVLVVVVAAYGRVQCNEEPVEVTAEVSVRFNGDQIEVDCRCSNYTVLPI